VSEDEPFLSRWSRRKRETVPPHDKAPAQSHEPTPAEPESAEPAFDLSSLPSLESITMASDVRPFLMPGVPAELTRAALRRAWTVDPAIRDFVGLVECGWDFNAANSMPGFGPLEMTDELRRLVERMFDAGPQHSPALAAGTPATPAEPLPRQEPEPTAPAARISLTAQSRDELPQDGIDPAAVQPSVPEDRASEPVVRRTHGRALPKC
jgi:pyruvate/2-oxoglutarate dehydrogenase complex dihydrolipoamide acyltransferase (E2) component